MHPAQMPGWLVRWLAGRAAGLSAGRKVEVKEEREILTKKVMEKKEQIL